MKKRIFGFIIGFTIIFTPYLFAYAGGLVPDCGKVVTTTDSQGKTTSLIPTQCNFSSVIELVNNIIHFLLFDLATPLAAIAICYAGSLLLFSGGSSEKISKAKKILKNVIIGYILALAAWLIINTIFSTLGFKGVTFLK